MAGLAASVHFRASAQHMGSPSDTNRRMGLHKKGRQKAEEGSDMFERFSNIVRKAQHFIDLALLWRIARRRRGNRTPRNQSPSPLGGQKSRAYQGRRVLTNIHYSEGERGDVVHYLEAARETISSLNRVNKLF